MATSTDYLRLADDHILTDADFLDVKRVVLELLPRWQFMTDVLGISSRIKDATSQNLQEQCMDNDIHTWLRRAHNEKKHGPPTWKRLVEAIADNIGGKNPAYAEEIAKERPIAKQQVPAPPHLDSKPTLQELQSRDLLHSRQYSNVVEGMAAKWKRVAIQLDINSARINIFDANSRRVEDTCLDMLQWWLENAEKPTWRALIEALRDIDLRTLAHNIEKALK